MVLEAGSLYTSVQNALQVITPANVTNPVEFWLSFLLVLAILNTVLKKVSFFQGNENKGARALTALIISFFAVTAAWVSPVLMYMASTLAVTAMILVAILIVAALAGYDDKLKQGKAAQWLFVGAIIVLFAGGLFSYAVVPPGAGGNAGTSGGSTSVGSQVGTVLSSFFSNSTNVGLLIVAIAVIVIIAWMFGGSSSDSKS